MDVVIPDRDNGTGNCYHRIDEDGRDGENREGVRCNTFFSKGTEIVSLEKAKELGFEECGYERCFGDER